MLTCNSQSSCDTLTYNQHMKGNQIRETETKKQNYSIYTNVLFLTAGRHNGKALDFVIRMSYFHGNME